jgi:large exoprotein involved in heme utilization and adhesion
MRPHSVSFDWREVCRSVAGFAFVWYSPLPLACLMLGLTYEIETVQAQSIAPEVGPNGTGTLVTPSGLNPNQLDIEGGTLSGDRANLFHSLERFGLNQGEIANFISQPQIRNILTRVVGGVIKSGSQELKGLKS